MSTFTIIINNGWVKGGYLDVYFLLHSLFLFPSLGIILDFCLILITVELKAVILLFISYFTLCSFFPSLGIFLDFCLITIIGCNH